MWVDEDCTQHPVVGQSYRTLWLQILTPIPRNKEVVVYYDEGYYAGYTLMQIHNAFIPSMRNGELFEQFFADGEELGNDEEGNIPTGMYEFKADEPYEYLPQMYDLIHGSFTTNPDATYGLGVDLGLPSGKLWAIQNVNSTQPYFAGKFFTWGNAEGVDDSEASLITPESYEATPGAALEGDTIPSEEVYDAAVNYFGNGWRMPTRAEIQELIDNCDWEYTSLLGFNGYRVKSRVNANSIFIPLAGNIANGVYNPSGGGYYWSANRNASDNLGYMLQFDSTQVRYYKVYRDRALPIRAIHEAI